MRRMKARSTHKGRSVDAKALAEVRALLEEGRRATGVAPHRRDLLIEHLHRIQDHYRQLSAAHLAALAQEMRLSQAEVYEVATFYHHFDVVKEGALAPAGLTVRVCDSLSCELAGAKDLLDKLPQILGRGVRVIAAPCVGRCESAPCAVVHQNPVLHATAAKVKAAVAAKATRCAEPAYLDYAKYRKAGGYRLLADCLDGRRTRDEITQIMEHSGLRGLGGAGFTAGRKWRIVAAARNRR